MRLLVVDDDAKLRSYVANGLHERDIRCEEAADGEEALAALESYSWPGNVRELSNEISQAVLLLEPGEPLEVEHLSERLRRDVGELGDAPLSLEAQLQRAERAAYVAALAASGDDPLVAMEQLGVSRATFYRKIKELGLREE